MEGWKGGLRTLDAPDILSCVALGGARSLGAAKPDGPTFLLRRLLGTAALQGDNGYWNLERALIGRRSLGAVGRAGTNVCAPGAAREPSKPITSISSAMSWRGVACGTLLEFGQFPSRFRQSDG